MLIKTNDINKKKNLPVDDASKPHTERIFVVFLSTYTTTTSVIK